MFPLFLLLLVVPPVFSSIPNTTVITVTTPFSTLLTNQSSNITIHISPVLEQNVTLNCTASSRQRIILPEGLKILITNGISSVTVPLKAGMKGGTVYISTTVVDPLNSSVNISDLHMSVIHSKPVELVSTILGWMCFAAWSISFYPQIFLNWRRKSVVGLSFDFLGYNMLGWICYSVFNFSLLWVEEIKADYYVTYPHGIINVQLSDFCFSFHALIITGLTILQCLCYERGGQTPSPLCRTILGGFLSIMVIMLIVAASSCISWLQYVTLFSYVKLAVTIFKYSPQVFVNFKNKSTEAVSIYQFLLDMTGATLSLLQMALIAYNYDDWKTFIGDFTKFGLAALSILYDLIFIVQHYVLYRGQPVPHRSHDKEDRDPLLPDSV